jgi:hypothetical protein
MYSNVGKEIDKWILCCKIDPKILKSYHELWDRKRKVLWRNSRDKNKNPESWINQLYIQRQYFGTFTNQNHELINYIFKDNILGLSRTLEKIIIYPERNLTQL